MHNNKKNEPRKISTHYANGDFDGEINDKRVIYTRKGSANKRYWSKQKSFSGEHL